MPQPTLDLDLPQAPAPDPNRPAIYVDALMPCERNERWPFESACHLFTTPGDAAHMAVLHAFAKALGLKRHWFQYSASMPHYDLNKSKRRKAVQSGAIELERAPTVAIVRQWRAHRAPEKTHDLEPTP
jgi:hypothetical protein